MANDSSNKKGRSKRQDRAESDALPAQHQPELERELAAKLEDLPEPRKQEVTEAVHQVVEASFQGPLPPPSMLRGYDDIVPGAADRIIVMAEKEQAHRHSWEQSALSADSWYAMLGMLAGWSTAIALAVGAAVAAVVGQPAVGIALAAASATGMVWKLIQGRSGGTEEPPQTAEENTRQRKDRSGRKDKRR